MPALSGAQTRERPRGTRTTTVPAILSCQPWRSASFTIQTKPYTGGTRVYNEYVNVLDGGQYVPAYR